MAPKTTPFHGPVQSTDALSVVSTEVDTHTGKKKLKNEHKTAQEKLLNPARENPLLFHARRCCCNIGFCAALFLIVFATFIACVVWVLQFVSGYVSVTSAITNVKQLVRSNAIFSLEDKLSEPAEMLSRHLQAAEAFNVTFTLHNEPRVTLHKMMMRSVHEYKKSLGVGIYYGTWTDVYGDISELPAGGFTNSLGENGILENTNYNANYELTAPPQYRNYSFLPTTRPWYKQSVQKGAPGISDVYIFVGDDEGKPGITYTQPIYNSTGQVGTVLAVDYVLTEMNALLRNIEVGKTGSSFLVERNGLLLASSKNITFVDNQGGRLSALESPDESQRLAARVIADSVGFSTVQSGFSTEYNAGRTVVEVYELNPRLKTTNQLLLDTPWLVVFIYPIFDDYTQIILWSTLGSVAVAVFAVVVSCAIAIGFVMCTFVLPLNVLVQDMAIVQSMELGKIKKRTLTPLFELRQMQKSFYRTLDFLRLYRSFLPSYLVQDQAEEESMAGGSVKEGTSGAIADHHSETSSRRSGRSGGSIISQRTGVVTKNALQTRAMQKLHKFDIGLEHGEGVALVVNILFWKQVCDMNQHEFVEQHTRIISVVQSTLRLHGGMLDRFSEEKIVGSFFEMRRGVTAAVDLRKKLLTLVAQFKLQYAHLVNFSLGLSHGEISLGVLGSDELRSKRVFGRCVSKAKSLSALGAEWPCKLFVDRDTLRRIDTKKWICRPVATLPAFPRGPVSEIVTSSSIKSDEWIYEKRDITKNEAIKLYRKAFESMEKERFDKAKELFNAYLEVNPEDELAQMHMKRIDTIELSE